MKKIVVVLLLVLMATSVFASPADINGYAWVAFSYDAKMMFTLGVLAGIYRANILLLGDDPDGITFATIENVRSIVEALDYGYKDASTRSFNVVVAIAVAWNMLKDG